MSNFNNSNCDKELFKRMDENISSIKRTEDKWASRVSLDDFIKIDRLVRDMEFLLAGFDYKDEE